MDSVKRNNVFVTIIQLSKGVRFLLHVSTHLRSHPQALLNFRLFTVQYYMIARLRSYRLYNTCLNKLVKEIYIYNI
jgi:hypothetical protein